jgi:amidase
VIWGKTNTPYLAGDNQTFNPVHGRTCNPHDLSRTPGGSSGGAAAALAIGATPLELGSDIGGSLRFPAHFCGVAAHKPTFGHIPIRGHVPPEPGSVSVRDLNVAGPMARTAGDLRLLYSVLSGVQAPPSRKASLRGKRVGVWSSEDGFPLDKRCAAAVETAADAAHELGAHVTLARPGIAGPALMDLYLQLLLPILATDMPAPLVKAMELGRPITRMLAKREPYSRSKWALYSAATHHDWMKANEARERLKLQMESFFEDHHVLLAPIAPTTAFEHVEHGDSVTRRLEVDGEPTPYHTFHGWIALATVCHLPATVISTPRRPGELPAGVQIIGPEGADLEVLAIAEALEAEMGGFLPPPELSALTPAEAAPSRPANGRKAPRPKPERAGRKSKSATK